MTYALHLGSCLDPITGMASLAGGSVDHLIADPPYEAEAHTKGRRCGAPGGGAVERPLPFPPITEGERTAAAIEFVRLARRWILVFCQVEAAMRWRDALVSAGASYKRTCVWVKPGSSPQFTGDRPGMGYESLVACHATGGRSRWNAGGKHGVYTVTLDPAAGRIHSTQKPIELMEQLVRDFTDPGETILDPFAGSGTTGVACIRMGRNFVGWEKDPTFHAAALRRLAGTFEQPELCLGKPPKQKQSAIDFCTPTPEAT